ncbi:MAG TPA: hypothetical protein VGX91_04255, partial [Candidatus Cybelea sp.]|nr:hypothetical protein [Candidatus Cybelea sp.]
CGGGLNTPDGSVVNSPGGSGPPPTHLVKIHVSITVPAASGLRPDYLSSNTESVVIQLTSVDGDGVTGVNPAIVNTAAHSRACKQLADGRVCNGTALGSPGQDVFAVTTYSSTDGNGSVLSVGSVRATIGSGGGTVGITNDISLSLYGVIASLRLQLSPNAAKRGHELTASVSLDAFDASGAEIVGPSDYTEPISLSIEGDTQGAFKMHAGKSSGESLRFAKPPGDITLTYDGNKQASAITVAAAVSGPSGIGTSAGFALHGRQPPPPVGTIYVLNMGSNYGQAATITEYDGSAKGNASPQTTIALDKKLYARSLAIDPSGNLYVGYFDNEFGFQASDGEPDAGNEIAIYARGASGDAQPKAVLLADKKTKTTIFPLLMAFDSSGRLVTYGATALDGNDGDAVLTYPVGASGAAAPEDGFDFNNPQLRYDGPDSQPTGLAVDAGGNVYVNGALHTSLGPSYGLFVAAAADIGKSGINPARVIPWNPTTELSPNETTEVALNSSGEILVGNVVAAGSGSSTSCQARVNVFAVGASGGSEPNNPPLRVLTLDGILTQDPTCASGRNLLVPFFPAIAMYQSTLFVTDDFNNAIDAFPSSAHGTVKPSLQIAGSATQLDAPIAVAVTSASGRAPARPAHPSTSSPHKSI